MGGGWWLLVGGGGTYFKMAYFQVGFATKFKIYRFKMEYFDIWRIYVELAVFYDTL